MSSNKKHGRGSAASHGYMRATAQARDVASEGYGLRTRAPLVLTLVWLGLTILALFLQGCPRFGLGWVLDMVFTLGLGAAELAFLDAIYRKERAGLVPSWKKFTGYSLVLLYVFQALPRVAWRNAGLISETRAAFIYALSLLCLAVGWTAFFLAGRPGTLAHFGIISEEEARNPALRKKNRAKRQKGGFVHGLLEWVDAIAFAAIAVIAINIFIFQLYVIPSESMVPGFLINDRPFTTKLTMGPRLPLTEWRLPFITEPRRGDIVTIANPRYPENHEVNVRKQLSQFVYMLTFTGVNLDRDADGNPKNDPLVKRIVGVPGEKLMMIDDVLYAKTKADADFKVVEDDRKWANVDLWKLDPARRAFVRTMPLDERGRAVLEAVDRKKNTADIAALGKALDVQADRILLSAAALRGRAQPVTTMSIGDLRDEAVNGSATLGAGYLAGLGVDAADLPFALAAAKSPAAAAALAQYARDGATASRIAPADPYGRGSRALELLIKTNILDRIERDLALLAAGSGLEAINADARLAALSGEAQELRTYLLGYYDARNFPVFPAGDAFLGPDEYFAMGDNRYNSLDFRFEERYRQRPLDAGDPSPVSYRSLLAPFALEKKYIEGKAIFILWPPNRLGSIHE